MITNKKGIIVILATKNRLEFLKNALKSISLQTKNPLDVFVTSDSNEKIAIEEKKLCDYLN